MVSEVYTQPSGRHLHILDIHDLSVAGVVKIRSDFQPIGIRPPIYQRIALGAENRVAPSARGKSIRSASSDNRIRSRSRRDICASGGKAGYNKPLGLVPEVNGHPGSHYLNILNISNLGIAGVVEVRSDLQQVGIHAAIEAVLTQARYKRVISAKAREDIVPTVAAQGIAQFISSCIDIGGSS